MRWTLPDTHFNIRQGSSMWQTMFLHIRRHHKCLFRIQCTYVVLEIDTVKQGVHYAPCCQVEGLQSAQDMSHRTFTGFSFHAYDNTTCFCSECPVTTLCCPLWQGMAGCTSRLFFGRHVSIAHMRCHSERLQTMFLCIRRHHKFLPKISSIRIVLEIDADKQGVHYAPCFQVEGL
jgi:hypothetical protein